jgi:hypothetical protein
MRLAEDVHQDPEHRCFVTPALDDYETGLIISSVEHLLLVEVRILVRVLIRPKLLRSRVVRFLASQAWIV